MITDIEIRRVEDLSRVLMDQEYNAEIDRLRSAFFFRGMPDASFPLTTSISRCCKEKQAVLEPSILRNFTKYASIEDPTLSDSVWKQMIVGQHHGLPTRLLDWTHSPLVALHFADTETDLDMLPKRDAIVWRIDARDLNKNLPEKYQSALNAEKSYLFSVGLLQRVAGSIRQYDEDLNGQGFVMLEPPSIDQRIINQYSFFSVIPNGMTDIEGFLDAHTTRTVRYIIGKEVRWALRDILDQYNTSERVIYPGLDGVAKWVGRHYFVKEEKQP